MNLVLTKTPMREQKAEKRRYNFEEVALGYDLQEALQEAERCIQCKNPRCVKGCPVNVRIPEFIDALKRGELEEAYNIIKDTNNLPAICGRVCPQEEQCEKQCILAVRGESVAIGRLERFVADSFIDIDTDSEHDIIPNGKKVAIIGSGPAGLTAAVDLAKLHYDVTVFEAFHEPGGVLVYGIPEFRLPKDMVKKEINKIKKLGVKFKMNVIIGKTS